ARCLIEGRWSEEIPVATSPASEWQPSVSVDAKGTAWVAYDTYEHGNYDVYLTSVSLQGGKVAERIAIARGPEFEAQPSVLADADGRVWVAYVVAGPNWGKDFRAEPSSSGEYVEPLHATRRLEL